MRLRLAAALTAGAVALSGLLAVPATAAPADPGLPVTNAAAVPAGTLVFIKGYNIWLSRGDGSGQYQVTTNGTKAEPYEHPTMSDNGLIAVRNGREFGVLRQNGDVVSVFTPLALFLDNGGVMSPPADPTISPDGTRIAYSQLRMVTVDGKIKVEALTGVSRADRAQFVGRIVIGSDPAWITNDRLVMSRFGDIHLRDVSADSSVWFHTDDLFDDVDYLSWFGLYGPQLSPDGRLVAFQTEDTGIGWATVTGSPRTSVPGIPTFRCFVYDDDPSVTFDDPSFGPDSNTLVYQESNDINLVTNISACDATTTVRTIVAGGTGPYWSKAPLNPGPRAGTPGTPGTGTTAKAFTVKELPKLKGKPKVGKKLTATTGVWSPKPTSYTYKWLKNGKAIKGATAATYRIKKADKRKKITVKVTAKRSGYKAKSAVSKAKRVK